MGAAKAGGGGLHSRGLRARSLRAEAGAAWLPSAHRSRRTPLPRLLLLLPGAPSCSARAATTAAWLLSWSISIPPRRPGLPTSVVVVPMDLTLLAASLGRLHVQVPGGAPPHQVILRIIPEVELPGLPSAVRAHTIPPLGRGLHLVCLPVPAPPDATQGIRCGGEGALSGGNVRTGEAPWRRAVRGAPLGWGACMLGKTFNLVETPFVLEEQIQHAGRRGSVAELFDAVPLLVEKNQALNVLPGWLPSHRRAPIPPSGEALQRMPHADCSARRSGAVLPMGALGGRVQPLHDNSSAPWP
mmetsp:Transcript_57878/g.150839  ORF Transcript_57878/g.150839 Transcript_57878/m.150839 type:complete len:299 (+) Transcript_57878:363-1259(+)